MNENLNLVEILKDCPKGTKLYSTVFGEVEFEYIEKDSSHPIIVKTGHGCIYGFTESGELHVVYDGECTLFPSREQRDWSKFNPKKEKKENKERFDPKTLQPFDKVLVRDYNYCKWECALFSHADINYNYNFVCCGLIYKYCVPYNDDTKHLVGTAEEAPEFYRYWKDKL